MSNNHQENKKQTILKMLTEKSVMKQDVFSNTIDTFNAIKDCIKLKADDLNNELKEIDNRVQIQFKDTNAQAAQLKVAGDVLEFFMHTNVFEFDKSHPMFKTGYIKNNELNSYCGIINIYNFLSDSFKYNRLNDLGYLIARIFINREKKFFIETRTQIGYKYANFSNEPINSEIISDIINELIIFSISFDLFTPPFDAVKQVSVLEIQEKASSSALRTGKRLGYSSGANNSSSFINDDFNL